MKEVITEKEYQRLKRNQNQRLFQRAARHEALKKYGGKCACCGEANIAFLTISRGKNNEAKTQIKGSQIGVWLKQNNYPKGFRILCSNCNYAIAFYGKCPHKSGNLTKRQEPDLESLRPKR